MLSCAMILQFCQHSAYAVKFVLEYNENSLLTNLHVCFSAKTIELLHLISNNKGIAIT